MERAICATSMLCQAGAEQIALVIHEYLGLVFEAAERAGMDDAVAVALEFAAAARRVLGNFPAVRVGFGDGIRRKFNHC